MQKMHFKIFHSHTVMLGLSQISIISKNEIIWVSLSILKHTKKTNSLWSSWRFFTYGRHIPEISTAKKLFGKVLLLKLWTLSSPKTDIIATCLKCISCKIYFWKVFVFKTKKSGYVVFDWIFIKRYRGYSGYSGKKTPNGKR